MKNLFEDKTDKELKTCFEQFQEWERTGVIPDNEFGDMRDIYSAEYGVAWHPMFSMDLLKTIALRWAKSV